MHGVVIQIHDAIVRVGFSLGCPQWNPPIQVGKEGFLVVRARLAVPDAHLHIVRKPEGSEASVSLKLEASLNRRFKKGIVAPVVVQGHSVPGCRYVGLEVNGRHARPRERAPTGALSFVLMNGLLIDDVRMHLDPETPLPSLLTMQKLETVPDFSGLPPRTLAPPQHLGPRDLVSNGGFPPHDFEFLHEAPNPLHRYLREEWWRFALPFVYPRDLPNYDVCSRSQCLRPDPRGSGTHHVDVPVEQRVFQLGSGAAPAPGQAPAVKFAPQLTTMKPRRKLSAPRKPTFCLLWQRCSLRMGQELDSEVPEQGFGITPFALTPEQGCKEAERLKRF